MQNLIPQPNVMQQSLIPQLAENTLQTVLSKGTIRIPSVVG